MAARKSRSGKGRPTAGGLQPAIDQLKAIVQSSGLAILTEGPVHPDQELLELCSIALHAAKQETAARDRQRALLTQGFGGRGLTLADARLSSAHHAEVAELEAQIDALAHQFSHDCRKIGKIPATTPAGLYAKAMVVRVSKTGARMLTISLAQDMLDCPGLRQSLWPTSEVPQ